MIGHYADAVWALMHPFHLSLDCLCKTYPDYQQRNYRSSVLLILCAKKPLQKGQQCRKYMCQDVILIFAVVSYVISNFNDMSPTEISYLTIIVITSHARLNLDDIYSYELTICPILWYWSSALLCWHINLQGKLQCHLIDWWTPFLPIWNR